MRRALAAFALLLTSCATSPPQIAVTVDDLPVHAPYPPGVTPLDVSRQMIAALKAGHVPAIGFVNGVNVRDAATMQALRDWRAAGFVLGNHGWSHRHLSEISLAEFEDELTRNEPILERLGAGADWRWFRYPFLDEGKDAGQRAAARQILARHGYRVAAVTIGFSDWQFTEAYARCMAAGDNPAVAELERLYLDAVRDSIAVGRGTARILYRRDIPYVLLMHVSAMSARMMPQVIGTYRAAGFRFVSLAEAERDPAYGAHTNLNLPPPIEPQSSKLPIPVDHSAKLASICR